jgi:hypothetical protein
LLLDHLPRSRNARNNPDTRLVIALGLAVTTSDRYELTPERCFRSCCAPQHNSSVCRNTPLRSFLFLHPAGSSYPLSPRTIAHLFAREASTTARVDASHLRSKQLCFASPQFFLGFCL